MLDQSFAEAATTAPILLLVDLADGVDAASGNWHAVADFIVKPPSPQELVFRADSIIRGVAARSEARHHAERLRERLRDVSAAIRTTNDPRVIADHVVNGFGKTFEADRVLFTTFEDQRVPRITAQWKRRNLPPLSEGLEQGLFAWELTLQLTAASDEEYEAQRLEVHREVAEMAGMDWLEYCDLYGITP